MHATLNSVLVSVEFELAELRLHFLLGETLDGALVAQAMANEVCDRADLHVVLTCELLDLRPARHRAVVVHQLTQHACRLQPGELAEIDRSFGMTRAYEHATRSWTQREDVSRPREIL